MSGFEIRTVWPNRIHEDEMDSPEDRITVSEVAVRVGGSELTRVIADDGVRSGPHVSAYRLAEWMVWNWWRLRWEPGSAIHSETRSLAWCRAHQTTGIGGAWMWPRMTIAGDGRRVVVFVSTTTSTETQPLTYVGGLGIVDAQAFEAGVDAFVRRVLDRLDASSERDTALHTAYAELQRERRDEFASLYRKIEAMWGRDVDCAAAGAVERFAADGLSIGRQAVEEVVADQSLHSKPSAEQLRRVAQRSGHEARPGDGVAARFAPRGHPGRVAPWTVGVDAARAVRANERLHDDSVSDDRLAGMYGVSPDCLKYRRYGPFAYALADEGARELVVLRSRSRTARRFEVARLLADRLLVESNEAMRPATGGATFRQKMQRAFAAEFLCPFDDLRERLRGDYSPENMERAAKHFRVSAWVVRSHLANHGLAEVPDRDEIDRPHNTFADRAG